MKRLQPEAAAAARRNIPLATFRHLVSCRKLPGPIPDIGLYDMKAIDAALDRMSGISGNARRDEAAEARDDWHRRKRGSR